MPFEIPQQEPQVEIEVGPFQYIADAILRGCAMSGPAFMSTLDAYGNTCAAGAAALGLGRDPKSDRDYEDWYPAVNKAYEARYGSAIITDNDQRKFTREQIAARIAALR